MSVIRVDNLTKSFGAETIFSNLRFDLRRGERIGLIGKNGAGKSTLMRCLLGTEKVDSGQVRIPEGMLIGYVEQDFSQKEETLEQLLRSAWADVEKLQQEVQTLEQAIAAGYDGQEDLLRRYGEKRECFERRGGYEYESTLRKIAAGLGFVAEDLKRPVNWFSGGQKTRIGLAKALSRQPDFLFLDEPTNHLDIAMVEWLESYLAGYGGGLFMISHDRYFLDRVATSIWELEQKALHTYRGNYSRYLLQKKEMIAARQAAYQKQQEYIAQTEAYIDKYRAGIKSKQARGRQSQLSRLERLEAPAQEETLQFEFGEVGLSGERVVELENAAAGYGEKSVFSELTLLLRRGERAALVGPNGVGKSTLLKVLTGEVELRAGRMHLGSRVKIGYFSQEHEKLCGDIQVLEEIIREYGMREERARGLLGCFLFQGEDVFKSLDMLSGGEKARLALLKLMLTGANFLVLDEPTNHLDIPAKEAVEEALLAFPGTFLTVSHDRFFLDKIAERVLDLTPQGLCNYGGNYSYYREKKSEEEAKDGVYATQPTSRGVKKTGTQRAENNPSPRKQEMLEEKIAELERVVRMYELQMQAPENQADATKSMELYQQQEEAKARLEEYYEQWLVLTGD